MELDEQLKIALNDVESLELIITLSESVISSQEKIIKDQTELISLQDSLIRNLKVLSACIGAFTLLLICFYIYVTYFL
jgi:hypothetical protein